MLTFVARLFEVCILNLKTIPYEHSSFGSVNLDVFPNFKSPRLRGLLSFLGLYKNENPRD